MSALFINGSPNKSGNTVALAEIVLSGMEHEQLDLVDYRIFAYGQVFADDRFDVVVDAMRAADVIVIGSPVYWHSTSGMLRNVLDRSYGHLERGEFAGRKLAFVFQGAAPTQEQLNAADYTMGRFAALYGMEYVGMATDRAQASHIAGRLSDSGRSSVGPSGRTP